MGKLCVLDSCSTNSSLVKPLQVILHRFPSEQRLKRYWEKWVHDVGGPILKDTVATKSNHRLCDKHFKPSDYFNTKLHKQAVPSIPPEPAINGQSTGENEASQETGKGRLNVDPVDFKCPVRAQKSLDTTADEVATTKRKLETMRLKYVRAMRRIQTLTDILNQLKDEKDFSGDCEIKVCSSCRKVNVCR